jgi:hypothetical protein
MNLELKHFLIDRDTLMIEKLTNGEQTADGKFAPKNKIGNRFKKGESGNLSGRPKLTRLTDALRQQLSEINPDAPEETVAEEIAKILIKLALSGDVQAIKEIGNRTEGLPKQAIDIDLQTSGWREEAQKYGLSEIDIINEVKLLIAEFDVDGSNE